jgi:uncharacterized membrane protein YbhN (UPF0104 family)
MPTLKRSTLLLLKTLFSVAAVAALVAGVDWRRLPGLLTGYRWEFAAAAFVGLMIQFPLSGLKWRAALQVCNVNLSFGRLTHFYCISHFVGQFLPTSIGGDAYRVYKVLPLIEHRSRAITSIVLDRVVGLAALMILGTVGALVLLDRYLLPQGFLVLLAAGSAAAAAIAAALYLGGFKVLSRKLWNHKWVVALRQDLIPVLNARWKWVPLLAMALLFQVVAVAIVYLLFLGTDSSIGFAEVALIAAVTGLAGMLPFAINGLGITEGSITIAGVALGADYEDAAVAAVLLRLVVMPLSLACGVLYWRESPASVESSDRIAA